MIDRIVETTDEILQRRARLLARPIAASDDTRTTGLDLLHFQVGTERLAISLATVVAIARTSGVAPLPRAVSPVYGVTAWRGRPITVLSLLPGRPRITPDSRLIVLGIAARASLAILVDAVDDIARTEQSALAPAGPGPRSRYALGITIEGLLVVDGEALLHPEQLPT
jgi:chemotaxis signal transduction protein